MKTEDEKLIEESEAMEASLKDPGKPEGLNPDQSQRWDDVEHDLQLLKNEGVCKGV